MQLCIKTDFLIFSMHQSGVLMDYVPMVTELLNNKVWARTTYSYIS